MPSATKYHCKDFKEAVQEKGKTLLKINTSRQQSVPKIDMGRSNATSAENGVCGRRLTYSVQYEVVAALVCFQGVVHCQSDNVHKDEHKHHKLKVLVCRDPDTPSPDHIHVLQGLKVCKP